MTEAEAKERDPEATMMPGTEDWRRLPETEEEKRRAPYLDASMGGRWP